MIEYTLKGIPDAEFSYRLITCWLDPAAAPALELAALDHQRWTIESSFDELKTHLADRRVVLRSKRPELVEQEFYALLLVHAAIRHLMTEAVRKPVRQPRICPSSMRCASSIAASRQAALFPPRGRSVWFQSVLREIASGRAVTSRGKRNPRGVRRKMSSYPIRDRGDPLQLPCDPCPVIVSN